MTLPKVVIVGAPNVGKSTLFNRLLGRRRAIVTDHPGMTRDRLEGTVAAEAVRFVLVDTGGLTPGLELPYADEIERQVALALAEAALVLFVVDVRAGTTPLDLELADRLRRRRRPLLLVANKADTEGLVAQAAEFHALGLGAPFPVAAEHGRGVPELVAEIARALDCDSSPAEPPADERAWVSVAIIGRPNVGKSSIFNRLVGQERALVSEVPGTTRDSIDTLLEVGERRYRLIDTAGIRRAGRVERGPERMSVLRARSNLERADVAVLVLDASAGLAAQDAHVAGLAHEAFRPLVVAVNKWDLVENREAQVKRWEVEVRERLRFAKETPLVFVSARSGQRVPRVLDLVDDADRATRIRVATPELNRRLALLPFARGPARGSGGGFRVLYGVQIAVRPPWFVLFCNEPKLAHFSTRRQIENLIRERFGFGPAPIRLELRGRERRRRGGGATAPAEAEIPPAPRRRERAGGRRKTPRRAP